MTLQYMGLLRVKTGIYATHVRFELVPRGLKGDQEASARERTGYRAPPSSAGWSIGGCCKKCSGLKLLFLPLMLSSRLACHDHHLTETCDTLGSWVVYTAPLRPGGPCSWASHPTWSPSLTRHASLPCWRPHTSPTPPWVKNVRHNHTLLRNVASHLGIRRSSGGIGRGRNRTSSMRVLSLAVREVEGSGLDAYGVDRR